MEHAQFCKFYAFLFDRKADLLILLTPEGVANLDIPMHAILEKHGALAATRRITKVTFLSQRAVFFTDWQARILLLLLWLNFAGIGSHLVVFSQVALDRSSYFKYRGEGRRF